MKRKDFKACVAELLLAELRQDGPDSWFYISMATEREFLGGVFLRARGPTDAFTRLHWLGIFPEGSGASTRTLEVPDINVVPLEMRWKKLTRDDLETLDRINNK